MGQFNLGWSHVIWILSVMESLQVMWQNRAASRVLT